MKLLTRWGLELGKKFCFHDIFSLEQLITTLRDAVEDLINGHPQDVTWQI